MRKIMISLMAVVAMFIMTGCDVPPFDDDSGIEGTKVCTVWNDGVCMAYTTIPDGSIDGVDGLSAYELAVIGGFVGTEAEWLESLKGEAGTDGLDGMSAYELAVLGGFEGTLEEWLLSLIGATGDAGEDGKDLICYSWEPIVPCEPVIPEIPIADGFARVTFKSSVPLTNIEVGHLIGMGIVSLDAVEGDGLVLISKDVNISDAGEHMLGYRFNK